MFALLLNFHLTKKKTCKYIQSIIICLLNELFCIVKLYIYCLHIYIYVYIDSTSTIFHLWCVYKIKWWKQENIFHNGFHLYHPVCLRDYRFDNNNKTVNINVVGIHIYEYIFKQYTCAYICSKYTNKWWTEREYM